MQASESELSGQFDDVVDFAVERIGLPIPKRTLRCCWSWQLLLVQLLDFIFCFSNYKVRPHATKVVLVVLLIIHHVLGAALAQLLMKELQESQWSFFQSYYLLQTSCWPPTALKNSS